MMGADYIMRWSIVFFASIGLGALEIFSCAWFCRGILGIKKGREKWFYPLMILAFAGIAAISGTWEAQFLKFCIFFFAFWFLFKGGVVQKIYTAVFSFTVLYFSIYTVGWQFVIGGRFGHPAWTDCIAFLLLWVCTYETREIEDPGKSSWFFVAPVMMAMGAIACSYNIFWGQNGMLTENETGLFIFIWLLFVANMGLFVFYRKSLMEKRELKRLAAFQEKNALEQLHYKRMEEIYGDYRGLAHDMNHYLSALSELSQSGRSPETEFLAEEIRERIARTGQKVYSGRPVLNAVLNEKEKAAEGKGISCEFFVEPGFDLEGLDDFSVIGILSNLLDNAMEAAEKCDGEKKFVKVNFFAVNDGKQKFLRVENGASEKSKEKRFFTMKTDKKRHGYGLKNVQKLVEENGGLFRLEEAEGVVAAEVIF